MQKQLIYITKLLAGDLQLPKLRGIIATWRQTDHTVCLSFYFDGFITQHDQDEVSDLSAGIIAHFPDSLLEDRVIRLDKPKLLPESSFWAYKQ
jgi:hypothetical protein